MALRGGSGSLVGGRGGVSACLQRPLAVGPQSPALGPRIHPEPLCFPGNPTCSAHRCNYTTAAETPRAVPSGEPGRPDSQAAAGTCLRRGSGAQAGSIMVPHTVRAKVGPPPPPPGGQRNLYRFPAPGGRLPGPVSQDAPGVMMTPPPPAEVALESPLE